MQRNPLRTALATFFLLVAAVACVGGGGDPAAREEVPESFEARFAYVFQCPDGEAFVTRFRGDSVQVEYEVDTFTLPHAISASGARYSDGTRVLWNKGTEALLETPTDTLAGCQAVGADDPWEVARLLGYDFRAVGQEPGWLVEVTLGRRMHVLADYGEIRFMTGEPTVEQSEAETVYRARGEETQVVLRIRDEPCQDIMSGEDFPAAATLELGDRVHQGCGRALH